METKHIGMFNTTLHRTLSCLVTHAVTGVNQSKADPSSHAVSDVGMRSLAFWDWGFESRRRHWCVCLVIVVYCHVERSFRGGWSLVARSPTKCGVSECDREVSIMREPWLTRAFASFIHSFIHSFSILSDDRSKASSKTMPPYSAMQSLLIQMRISSPVLKVIQ